MNINCTNQTDPFSSEKVEVHCSEQLIEGKEDEQILENEDSLSKDPIEIQANWDSKYVSKKSRNV